MSNKTRLAKLKQTTTAAKKKPWLWGGHVGRTPPSITGMLVRCERAARGQIPFDRELIDELKWLDGYYSSDTCKSYLEYCDQFIAEFEANY